METSHIVVTATAAAAGALVAMLIVGGEPWVAIVAGLVTVGLLWPGRQRSR